MGLLVNDLEVAESGPDSVRVLKVALDTQAGGRLSRHSFHQRHDRRIVYMTKPAGPTDEKATLRTSKQLVSACREQVRAQPEASRQSWFRTGSQIFK